MLASLLFTVCVVFSFGNPIIDAFMHLQNNSIHDFLMSNLLWCSKDAEPKGGVQKEGSCIC